MKKNFALFLALVMCLSLFAACGGAKEESKAPESSAPASTAPESAAPAPEAEPTDMEYVLCLGYSIMGRHFYSLRLLVD